MDAHPDDVSTTDDLTLVGLARAGDRLAFGVLYLRHHAAAWRVACISSRFSPDAELAVIEGFTRVFSALPEESEDIEAGGVTFRPYLLACVRQSALDRARAAGRAERNGEAECADPGTDRGARRRSRTGPQMSTAPPAVLAGLTIDGEVRLSGLEHHIARGALAALSERARTTLWLSDVEAMTPGEVAGILGGPTEEIAEITTAARAELHDVQRTALDRQEVRAECRFSADHLAAFEGGTLEPADGLLVRAHLAGCLACRMRMGELTNTPAALAAAVPAAPLLGGETQHHWLASISDIRPAEHLLPPVIAAGGTLPRESLARRTATHLGTVAGVATAPARRLPDALRRASRAAAGAWQGDSIDLTTRPRPTSLHPPVPGHRPTSPTAGDSPPASGSPADPTTPPGWTGSPGWSGSPVPSRPPAWTIPAGRAAGSGAGRRRHGRTRRRIAAGALPALAGARPALALASGVPGLARRVRRATGPVLPAMALAVAWVLVMMSLPRLMTPATSPGPGGLALPAVQAYFPGFPPGSDEKPASPAPTTAPPAPSSAGALAAGAPVDDPAGDPAGGPLTGSTGADEPSLGLVAAASGPAAAHRPRPGSRAGQPSVSVPALIPTITAPAAAATAPLTLIPAVVTSPPVGLDTPIVPQAIETIAPPVAAEPEKTKATRAQPPGKAKADRILRRTEDRIGRAEDRIRRAEDRIRRIDERIRERPLRRPRTVTG